MPPTTALSDQLARLSALHPKKIDLSLGRVTRLLAALGDPHTRLAPVIHVAGTNGKGSTVAFLAAMAEAAGLKAHVYTSPHLVRFNERITVAGRTIEDDHLVQVLRDVETANAGEPITFFEVTTAAAFHAFAREPADVCLIEVGLGGRYDATNVFERPACSVITPVGLDHAEFLGTDIAGIAHEKAGVLKPGVPGVVGPQEAAARAAIAAEGLRVGAELIMWGADFRAHEEDGRLVFEGADRVLDLTAPGLAGRHQFANAAVAVAAACASGVIPESAVAEGVAAARWPGRLQRVVDGPLYDAVHPRGGGEVWIDGAHNAAAAAALAEALADLDDGDPRPLALVVGMQKTKDVDAFFAAFEGLARTVACTPIASSAVTVSAEALCLAAEARGMAAAPADSLDGALRLAGRTGAPEEPAPRVVICGSLYLAGEALALANGDERAATTG